MSRYAIGLDFGTNSCRSMSVHVGTGQDLASDVFPYPSGSGGVILDPLDPSLARQNPADYLLAIEATVKGAISKARSADAKFNPQEIIGIGVDTTGSSPMPVDAVGYPLCFQERSRNNPAATVWLWKDRRLRHSGLERAHVQRHEGAAEYP
jgi:L-ribulokinase